MLRIRNLEAGYGSLKVLRNISLHVAAGEIVTLIGANGAGKSTLLRAVSGLIAPAAGTIQFEGRDIAGQSTERIVSLGCSLVPEGRQIFPVLSVRENLLLGGTVLHRRGGPGEVARELHRVFEIFPRLGEREGQLAGTLSGGEQQMLAMGRALMARPKLVMMDEPSMGLAPLMVREILKTVARLRDEGNTVLLVEQNARAALGVADRGYVLETGKLILEGRADFLLADKEVRRAYLGKGYRRIEDA